MVRLQHVQCGIACHGPDTECPNVQPMNTRTQQAHWHRTGVEAESKRRRHDTVGNIVVDEVTGSIIGEVDEDESIA